MPVMAVMAGHICDRCDIFPKKEIMFEMMTIISTYVTNVTNESCSDFNFEQLSSIDIRGQNFHVTDPVLKVEERGSSRLAGVLRFMDRVLGFR